MFTPDSPDVVAAGPPRTSSRLGMGPQRRRRAASSYAGRSVRRWTALSGSTFAAGRECTPPSAAGRRGRGWTVPGGGGKLLLWRQPSTRPGVRSRSWRWRDRSAHLAVQHRPLRLPVSVLVAIQPHVAWNRLEDNGCAAVAEGVHPLPYVASAARAVTWPAGPLWSSCRPDLESVNRRTARTRSRSSSGRCAAQNGGPTVWIFPHLLQSPDDPRSALMTVFDGPG